MKKRRCKRLVALIVSIICVFSIIYSSFGKLYANGNSITFDEYKANYYANGSEFKYYRDFP